MSYGRSPPRIDGMVSLKVDNLAYRTTVEDLRRIFSRYGEVGDVYIPRNPYSMDSRGFAFVRYYSDRDAEDAIRGMDGRKIDGREIRVQRAMYGRPNSRRRGREGLGGAVRCVFMSSLSAAFCR
ncbi:Serine/arginine-rich splicing factor 2 [Echinococcus granulosus]|uniref:Serine/arginine-rich splicing factor 2 n=1 Tax=Echinococcus granulosus TaxID=6210 RepID=A0A068W7F6_ECHGR|nr:Serine/arginine-rich splicing factor 2 [Echinococcus granulosus]CDS15617.1 Splicing factor arginine:serine rich 2 [Echinococcus granulosus]